RVVSLRRTTKGCRMTRQFDLFASVADLRSVDLQDRYVTVEKVANVGIGAVWRKGDTLSKTTNFDFADSRHLLAVDLEHHCRTCFAGNPSFFVRVSRHQNRKCQVALGADGEALRRITYYDVIDDARRI